MLNKRKIFFILGLICFAAHAVKNFHMSPPTGERNEVTNNWRPGMQDKFSCSDGKCTYVEGVRPVSATDDHTDENQMAEIAAAEKYEGKVLVEFGFPGCSYCEKMEKENAWKKLEAQYSHNVPPLKIIKISIANADGESYQRSHRLAKYIGAPGYPYYCVFEKGANLGAFNKSIQSDPEDLEGARKQISKSEGGYRTLNELISWFDGKN